MILIKSMRLEGLNMSSYLLVLRFSMILKHAMNILSTYTVDDQNKTHYYIIFAIHDNKGGDKIGIN